MLVCSSYALRQSTRSSLTEKQVAKLQDRMSIVWLYGVYVRIYIEYVISSLRPLVSHKGETVPSGCP